MKNKILLIAALTVFSAHASLAQTDTTAKPKNSLVVKYLVSADLSFTAGNLVSFTTVNKGQLELERRVIGTKLMVAYRYGTIDTAVNSNELTTSLFINIFPRNRVYGFVNGGFEKSFLRAIEFRAYGGIGAGFRVVKTETNEFEPFVNVLYEYNKYDEPLITGTDTSDVLQTFRAVVGWTGLHKVFKQRLIITHNAKYTQSLQVANNFRAEANLALTLPIYKIFSAKTAFGFTYENVVPEGRKQADFIWTIGLVLSNI